MTVVHNEGLEDMGRFTLGGSSVLMDTDERLSHYHVNMAALMELGKWFDWLRAQGTYDNTRIIVVSDHGRPLGQWPELIKDEHVDVEGFNPLLMAKDFDAHGFSTSHEFMTNADVPTLATQGVIEGATNPFTGVAITSDEKYAHDQLVTSSQNWETSENNTFDTTDSPWYSVHDDIFEESNWQRLD
jgi:phosphoglycerol transferase MdoB-like AlkP superfamily enzyme